MCHNCVSRVAGTTSMSQKYLENIPNVKDAETLWQFMRDCLGWQILDPENATRREAQITEDVKGLNAQVRRLRPQADDDAYSVYLVEFEEAYNRRDLRALLASVKRQEAETGKSGVGDTIYIVAQKDYADVRFVLFRAKERGQPEIRSFGWVQGQTPGRTLMEFNLSGLTWDKRAIWSRAWDVESLTKKFFSEISDLFYDTVDAVSKQIKDENDVRLKVQIVFNRLLFLRFVEEKGWLSLDGDKQYLQALWRASLDDKNPLWPTRLNALFSALNHEKGPDATKIAQPLIGQVPFLNGGLFEEQLDPTLPIPSHVLDHLIGEDGLFYRYNFVVEESTPLDLDLAIDPEMLGKIFERLTLSSKRHDTGSYYTPREIVQFMCREALVGYLGGKGVTEDKARKLVYEHDDSELTNPEGTLSFNALKQIKVVDPACGSGAYLLGMLQELYALFEKLRRDDRKFSQDGAREAHERKLWIIENNIYGVDLQKFATNTAMLRLWLTLLVEDVGEQPQPLPNLEYKIETGDALLGPDPSQPVDWTLQKGNEQSGLDFEDVFETVTALSVLRAKYQDAHGSEKLELKRLLDTKLSELREKVTGSPTKDPSKFDWRVEFFDVFLGDSDPETRGFDLVIMNPPYGAELTDANKKLLKFRYSYLVQRIPNTFLYFMGLGHLITRAGGIISQIVPNEFLFQIYMTNARRFFLENYEIQYAINAGEKIFDAIVPTCIVAMQKITKDEYTIRVADLRETGTDELTTNLKSENIILTSKQFVANSPNSIFTFDTVSARRVSDMTKSCQPFEAFCDDVASGISTSFDDAYIVPENFILDRRIEVNFVKPCIRGGQLNRYFCPLDTGERILYVTSAIERDLAPNLFDYLSEQKPLLIRKCVEKRLGKRHWQVLFRSRYLELFRTPKILIRQTADKIIAAPDQSTGYYCIDSVNVALLKKEAEPLMNYLLGVLNSQAANVFYGEISQEGGRILPQVKPSRIRTIPIPYTSAQDREEISIFVQNALDAKAADSKADISECVAEIDSRVQFLYFHRGERGTRTNDAGEEVPYPDTYDEWIALKAEEDATLLDLIAKGESATVEFKQSLEAVDTTDQKFANIPEPQRAQKAAETRKDLIHSVLKTLCAFRNSEGGTLLIGVHDEGQIIGLEPDYALIPKKPNKDGFENKLTDFMKTRLSPLIHDVKINFVTLEGKEICRIDITPGPPTYLDNELYIRHGNSTEQLKGRDLQDWLNARSKT
jgi:hypothetical protein